MSLHPKEITDVLKAFDENMGHCESVLDYHAMTMNHRIAVKDFITNTTYNMEVHSRYDDESMIKVMTYHLERVTKEMYENRGKHVSKMAPYKYSKTDYYDYEYGDMTSTEDVIKVKKPFSKLPKEREEQIAEAVKETVRKRKEKELYEQAKELEAQASAQAALEAYKAQKAKERKEAYSGNGDFGTF